LSRIALEVGYIWTAICACNIGLNNNKNSTFILSLIVAALNLLVVIVKLIGLKDKKKKK
jgi:hypothetical protein